MIDDGQIVVKENTEGLLARAYRISGEETLVDAAVKDLKVYHPESIGRNKVVTVLADEPVDSFSEDVMVEPVSLQNLFYAMSVDERKEA
jgi:ABC-2 type transport system ATP-binding protein